MEIDPELLKKMSSPLHRYMDDVWYFAVLLSNGKVLAFEQIDKETEDFYVLSLHFDDMKRFGKVFGVYMEGSPTSRTTCHVAKKHVVAFIEFADT